WLGIEDFTDGADTGLSEMRHESVQELARVLEIAGMKFEPGINVWSDQPGPDRALMIGGIAGAKIAIVLGFVVFVIGRERSQSNRRQQLRARYVQHRGPARFIQDR